MLEALALDAAEQALGLDLEAVERDLEFLHAAIADHLDLAARHAGRRKRIFVGAPRLFGEQHREPAIARLAHIGAHQERHQVGPRRVRDPGLVAVHPIDVAEPLGARLEVGEVRSGIGLGEHRGRQHLAGRDLGQPGALLLLGAAAEDQFGRDLGARAERAHSDIAARELLGDDAHRFLAEPHAAEFFRDGQPEHAELGHVRDDVERDVGVAEMPIVGMRHHLALGELAHLLADRIERIVEPAIADRHAVMAAHQLDEPRAARRIVAGLDQPLDPRRHPGRDLLRR